MPTSSRTSLLVVDDDPTVLRALTRLLERSYDVVALSSAHEVLRRVGAGERWDVILSDVMMPDMTGLELATRIAETHPVLARRIVLMTGGTCDERVRVSLETSACPIVHKPIELPLLRQVFARVCSAA